MILSLSDLKKASDRRLPGYFEAALSMGKLLGNNKYEFTNDQIEELSKFKKPMGLGDAAQKLIHASIDRLPFPKATADRIKGCGGCAKRAAAMNAFFPDIGLKKD